MLIDSKRVDGENYSLQVTVCEYRLMIESIMFIIKGISGNRSVSVPVRVDILPSFGVISK